MTRGGAKKKPYYRIVVADSRSPRDGKFIEKVGSYNPLLNNDDPKRVILSAERISYWLGVGAKPSDRVGKFIKTAGVQPLKVVANAPKPKAEKAAAPKKAASAKPAAAKKAPAKAKKAS